MKPNKKWLIHNPPPGYLASLKPLPEGATCTTRSPSPTSSRPANPFDGIQLFVRSKAELVEALKTIIPLLRTDTILWVSYPKKSSGIESDLKMQDWAELEAHNLQGVASIAVDEEWAGSRFRPRGQSKISGTGKAEIRNNNYAEFIDVDKKTVTLPPDLRGPLQKNQKAFSFYEQLSYSNRKEYVLWILTAKQEKTRAERIAKSIEKLAAGKRNPAEK